jgi:VWFA-related protein
MRIQRLVLLTLLAVPAVTAHSAVSARSGQQPQTRPPVFRSAVTLVPVDVRVVDGSGKPVTDLKPEEFTIIEDGARQEIRHFALQTFTPAEPAPGAKLALRQDAVSFDPQSNRIFLIVLGRGKLQEPSKAIDALLRFVRERLLPQDQVAVFAYNRATTFTTDHQMVARLLERFKTMHEQVDYEIGLQMSGLAAIYGSKLIPRSLQGKIDKMFEGSGLLASQRVEPGAPADKRIEGDAGRQTNALIQQETEAAKADMAAAAGLANLTTWSELDEIQTQMFADLSLEAFVATTAQTLQDLGNIYAGISYLRHFEGEKHLVFLTEKGLTLPRLEEDEILVAAANDARVVIDTIETGGIYVGQSGNAAGTMPEGRWNQTFAFKTLRTIADLTGGVSSIAESGTTALGRLNDVTRATYQLGFYPTNARWDGAYRKVTVKVTRPGVTVYYRHGYYGRKDLASFNRREFITADRIQAAASFRREIKDIRLKVDAGLARAKDGGGYELSVDVNIDPSKLAFTFVEGVHIGRISIAVFCFDEKGNGLGGNMENADLKLKDDVYKKVIDSGIPYKVTFPVNPGVRKVRVVVYDFKADLIGSADTSVL